MKPWFPSINFATPALRGACGNKSKFIWTPEMNSEFEKVKLIFTDQIRLSPFNPDKEINILIDAANKSGVGYCFYQYVNDEDKEGEVTIVNANSSALKDNQMQYSAIEICSGLKCLLSLRGKMYKYLYRRKCNRRNISEEFR